MEGATLSPKVLVILLATNLALAQEVNTVMKVSSPVTVAVPDSIKLPVGEKIVLRSRQQIWSHTAKAGDALEFEVIKPVKVGELVVIAEGAIATGKVTLVERPKSKGRGGVIGLTVDDVQLVTGEKLKTKAYDERNGGNNRSNDIGGLIMAGPLPGVGALLIPVALMLRGNEVMMVKGTRFTAVTDGEVSLKWEAVVAAQPIEVKNKDISDVYIYSELGKEGYVGYGTPITCGGVLLGMLENGRFLHVKLPPGTYWLHAGMFDIQLHKMKPERMFQLDVEAGGSYYLKYVSFGGSKKHPLPQFELVNGMTGAEEITETVAPGSFAVSPDIALQPSILMVTGFHNKCYRQDNLPLLRAQAGVKTKVVRQASQVQVECRGTILPLK